MTRDLTSWLQLPFNIYWAFTTPDTWEAFNFVEFTDPGKRNIPFAIVQYIIDGRL